MSMEKAVDQKYAATVTILCYPGLGDIEIAMSMEKAVDQKYAATVIILCFPGIG